MSALTRVHLTFVLTESEVPYIAAARNRWDPVMAGGVPPHVTLVYPEEYTDEGLLVQRATAAASRFAPFPLYTSELLTSGDDDSEGVFAAVSVPSGSWAGLRKAILTPPFTPKGAAPHITLVHPRTSRQGQAAWASLARQQQRSVAFTVSEFCLTSTDVESGMRVRQRFPLTAAPT